ncbi:hypothetical protein ACH5RR_028144 [Cinchona calisaya]|uniref:Uncharacterized protein n=1 Tax=Cinchona calisaya TaxID=153742 RepID=A0ABD2YT89_9GENT
MDLKIKGRTWVGNIYHKFETICQEVDDFVTKDTLKYVENQVQTVGENVKKIYSNVVHDFLPPLGDDKQAEAQAVTRTQDDAGGSHIRSMVGIKEKNRRSSERETNEEQDTSDVGSCNTSEVDHLVQFSPPLPSSDSPQVAETDIHWKEGSDAAIYNNRKMVLEENVAGEDYPATRYLSSPRDENSSELAIYWREQNQLTQNLESPEDGNLFGLSEISDEDQRNIILAEFSPKSLVEDAGLRTSQKDKTTCHRTDISEEAETVLLLSMKHDGETAIYKNSETGVEENATVEAKISCKLSYKKEVQLVTVDLRLLEDKSSSTRSSTNEYQKAGILTSYSQENLAPDTVLRVDPVEQAADNNADPCEEEVADLSSEHDDEHRLTTLDKFLPKTPVNDEGLRVFQDEEGVRDGPFCFNETDLSLDSYCSCISVDFSVEENDLVEKHAVTEYLGCPEHKSSCDLSLCPRKLLLEIDGVHSPKAESSSESSEISRTEDRRSTILANFSSVTSVHDAGLRASQKDETACNSFSDVFSNNLSFELASSCISWEQNIAETEASSSSLSTELLDMLEFLHANSIQKTQNICCDYSDSGVCMSALSSSSSASLSGLASGKEAVNLIHPFPSTASSADISTTNEKYSLVESSGNKPQQFLEDDSDTDIADACLERIDLSDNPKLEESCVIMDNELLCAASCRPRNFRSYKELIQDAFASRKRLIKEYELLPIWFGDIDTDINLHSDQCILPSVTSASRTSQANDLGESEWELV